MAIKMNNLQLIVNSNLTEIVESTTLSFHLCNILKEKKFVTQEEYEELTNFVTYGRHTQGASYLFTKIVRRIATADEEKFIEALQEGKNDQLIKILRSDASGEGDVGEGRFALRSLQKEEADFLRGFLNGRFPQDGKFEGLHFGDEEGANEVLRGSVGGGGSGWGLLEAEGVVETAEGEEFIGRVRSVVKCLNKRTLWWNPQAVPLPPNFIPRRVKRLSKSGLPEEPQLLSELTKPGYPFLWLVDSPGGGKSTVTTKLEEEWRRSMPSDRVIVRINLNSVQPQLQQEKQKKNDDVSLVAFLKRFVPFIPIDSLCLLPGGSVGVVILLDALDEVLPLHEDTMLRLLNKLLLSPHEAKQHDFTSLVLRRPDLRESLRLQKLFLTTRPHLRSLVEKEFGVTAHELLPLDEDEQVEFLSKEVSGEFEFTEDDAKMKLNSLPSSSRSLLGNPLMLFLFAQVIKHSGGGGASEELDLCGLYERFLVAKHAIHVAEKETADPAHPHTRRRMKNLLEENLPFYTATALTQLKPEEAKTWRKLVPFPNSKKREELLSFGLLTTTNSSHQLRFVHRSFAEFLYARLLTTPSTPTPLRDTLFSQIYSQGSPLENVEEFVLCTLRRRLAEFPGERLLPLSPHWLPGSTLWQRMRGQEMRHTLWGFLRGRLFPLLGEELLSSVDLTHPKVIHTLTSVACYAANLRLREWLTRRDPQWIRSRLFALPPTTTPTHDWREDEPELIARLLCEHPAFLPRSLSDEEIRSGLSACDNLVEIVCGYPRSGECGQIVERRMGRDALRVKITTLKSLEVTLEVREAAWWMAETLTREQFTQLLLCNSSVFVNNLRQFESAWGGAFTYRLIAGATGTTPTGHAQGDLSEFGAEGLLRMFGGGAEGMAALRFLIPRVGDTRLLEELEELAERRGRGESKGGASLLLWVFESEGVCLWDSVDKLPNVHLLPFVIRYGKRHKFKEMRPHDIVEPVRGSSSAGAVGAAFVLSVLVDSSPHTFDELKSIEITTRRYHSTGLDLWNFLSRVGVDDLRAASLSAGLSNVKGRWPLVRQVQWGQVVLSLLPQVPFTLNDDTLEAAAADFLRHVPCCEAPDLLLHFLHQNSSLRELLLRQVASEVPRTSRSCDVNSTIRRSRFGGFIQFENNVAREEFTPASPKSVQLFVMSVIVKSRLPSPDSHTPQGWSQVVALLSSLTQQLQSDFPCERKCPTCLLRIFGAFVTEWEWSVVLETLQLIPRHAHSEELPPESPRRFYGRPETPLLRVWLRHFGADETRKVAENLDWSKYRGHPGEAVLLAVELGSLPTLQKVAWPSLLWWRDEGGRSLLEIAVALWGEGHEVTSFLRGKFELTINSE